MGPDRASTPAVTRTDEPGRVPDVAQYDEPPKGLWQDGFGRAATRSVQALVVVALLALVAQVPGRRTRERLLVIGDRSTVVLGGYVRGTATIAFVDAIFIGGALVILRVPLALPLAVVVFIGAFIPLVGATVAGILAALIALVSNGLVTALIVVAVVVAVNQIEGDVLAPIVLGRSLRLHPLAILLALTAGTILAGIVGAILAVPFAAVAWATVKTWRELSGRPPSGALDEEPLPSAQP